MTNQLHSHVWMIKLIELFGVIQMKPNLFSMKYDQLKLPTLFLLACCLNVPALFAQDYCIPGRFGNSTYFLPTEIDIALNGN